MKFSPNYDWHTSEKSERPFMNSGLPFNIEVALWLWIGPVICCLVGLFIKELALVTLAGVVWLAFAGATRSDQISQLQHINSDPISESDRNDLITLGLSGSLASRVKLRKTSVLNANSWLGTFTFSNEYWDSLMPSERVAVIQRLARPYFLAFGWQILMLACVFVPAFIFLERATAAAFFSSYPEHEAKRYAEMIWKIPSFIAPMGVYIFTCNRLLIWGDRKFADTNLDVESLIGAFEKSDPSKTQVRRIENLRARCSGAIA